MKSLLRLLSLIVTITVAAAFYAPEAFAQEAADVTGTWALISLTVIRNGSEVELLGAHPQGQLILGNDGHYVLLGVRADLPKFAGDNRLSGSAEENQVIARGNVGHFGTYTVDQAEHVIVFHIQKSTFPNWDGVVQKRPFTVEGDLLTYITPGSFGYGAEKAIWRRSR